MKGLYFYRILVVMAMTLNSYCATAQTPLQYHPDSINQTDSQKLKQGKWILFDATGKTPLEQGFYKNNKKDSIWTGHYPNGNIKHQITFKNGIANGPAIFYYPNGKTWEEGTWVIDRWTGNYKFYYPSGSVAYDWKYNTAGKRTGEQKYFHENGRIKYAGTWENGKTTGTLKIFDEKGGLVTERVYRNGEFEMSVDHTNGQPDSSISVPRKSWIEFKGTGDHTIFNIQGQIEKKGYFEEGKLINGEQFIYNSNGKVETKLIFENGKLVKTIDVNTVK
jgi:antitoxin component YwqK of YwqJK toxin-antitoxin module